MKTIFLGCICLMLGTTGAWASPSEDGPPAGKLIKKRMLQLRAEVLKYEVGLDQAQLKKVKKVLQTFDPQREALQKRKRAAKRAAKRLMKSDSNDQAAYKRVLDEIQRVASDYLQVQKKQREAVRGLLTPKQQLKLLHSMRRIKRQLKRKMKEFKGIGPKGRRGKRGMHRRRGGGGDSFGPPGLGGGQGPRHPGPIHKGDSDWGDDFL